MRHNSYGQPIGAPVEGWRPPPHPPRQRIEGRYCLLEPVGTAHAAALFAAYRQTPDDRDWTYLFHERPADETQFRAYLAALEHSADALHFSIIERRAAAPLGTAALMRIEPAHGSIEVGAITVAPPLKHTPAATEAMYLLMRLAFDLGYRRYEWKCDSLNAPSRAAAERCGFTFEGIFRNAVIYKGRNRDSAWYAITAQDWPRVRAAFQAWLEPGNFDASGRQRRRLAELRAELGGG